MQREGYGDGMFESSPGENMQKKNTNKKRILTKVPINCKRYDKYDVNRLIQTQIGIAY